MRQRSVLLALLASQLACRAGTIGTRGVPDPGDTDLPGADTDSGPSLEVRLVDQLLGSASAVAAWGAGGVAALGGSVVRFDATGGITGRLPLGPSILDLAADAGSGRIAVALGSSGAVLIDASGADLVELARLPDPARGLWMDATRLVIVPGATGAALYELGSGAPVLADSTAVDGPSSDAIVVGSSAYLAQQDARLAIVPLADATHFAGGASYLLLDGAPLSLHAAGSTLYVATGLDGVAVVDISDPAAVASSMPAYFGSTALAVAGEARLFVAAGTDGVEEWAAADLSQPAASAPTYKARSLALAGDRLLVADDNLGVAAVDVSAAAPLPAPSTLVRGGAAGDVVLRDGYGLVAAGYVGLAVVDLATGELVAVHDVGATLLRLAVSGNLVLGVGDWSLVIIDLADPTGAPGSVARIDLPEPVRAAAAVGATALVAGESALYIVDASAAAAPALVTSVPVDGERSDLEVVGTLLAAAGEAPSLILYDLADPTAPTELGRLETGGRFADLASDGARLVALAGAMELSLIDLTTPSAPAAIASLPLTSVSMRVAVAGSRVWIADAVGLTAVDFDASGFATASRAASFGSTAALAVDQSRGIAAAAQAGVRLIEISEPAP